MAHELEIAVLIAFDAWLVNSCIACPAAAIRAPQQSPARQWADVRVLSRLRGSLASRTLPGLPRAAPRARRRRRVGVNPLPRAARTWNDAAGWRSPRLRYGGARAAANGV